MLRIKHITINDKNQGYTLHLKYPTLYIYILFIIIIIYIESPVTGVTFLLSLRVTPLLTSPVTTCYL